MATATLTKEPWQMTQREYVTDLSETFEPVVFGTQVGSKVRWRGTGEKAIAKQKADILRGAPEAHRYKVRQALKEGKPVPAEVLKDYPELAKGTPVTSGVTKRSHTAGWGEISQFVNRPRAKGFRIHIAETPKGNKWEFLGSIPSDLIEPGTSHSVSFNSREEAIQAARQAGYEEGKIYSTETGKESAIPKASPGMPEAGLQLDISGKTTAVMPKGKGKPVTASMESYAKLQKVRAEESPKEIFGTLSQEDASELVAGLDLRIDALEGRIDEGKATLEGIKGSVNPKVAKLTALIPATKEGKGEITHITKGQYRKVWGREPKANILTKDGKSVRWEYALDEIAQELHLEPMAQAEGKAPDEYLKGLIEEAKDTKELIRATESEVRSDESTLKALGKLKDTIKARTGKVTDGKLLEKLARAPKITITTKSKPAVRAKAMLAGVAQALIQKTQAKRPLRAIALDNALLAKTVVTVSKVEIWAKHPNRLDIRGIDTPSRSRRSKGVYADKGQSRMSRKPHRNWKRIY